MVGGPGGAEIGINGGGRDDEMNAATIATDAVRVIQSRRGLQVASVARYQVTKYVVKEVCRQVFIAEKFSMHVEIS